MNAPVGEPLDRLRLEPLLFRGELCLLLGRERVTLPSLKDRANLVPGDRLMCDSRISRDTTLRCPRLEPGDTFRVDSVAGRWFLSESGSSTFSFRSLVKKVRSRQLV